MNHVDHVDLLRDGVLPGGLWADIGSGRGAFTLALADLLGPDGQIHSLDKDRSALRHQQGLLAARFPGTAVSYHLADYTKPLDLPPLDGIIMANSLHFSRGAARIKVIQRLRHSLRPGGRFLLVEYDTDRGNFWVPHPLSFKTWQRMAEQAGFRDTRLLTIKPSRFLGQIYSAVSTKGIEGWRGA
jgi:SAM-dependent methyltransferase